MCTCKLLNIEQIRLEQIGKFFYRYEHNLHVLPGIYRQLFIQLFAIRATGINIWNSITPSYRLCRRQIHVHVPVLHVLKKELRRYLITQNS